MAIFKIKGKMAQSETITSRMGVCLERRQRRLADWMNGRMAKVSPKAMLFGLIAFCMVFGGYLLYLLLDTFGAFN